MKKTQQIDSLDVESRNQIWSAIYNELIHGINERHGDWHDTCKYRCNDIWTQHLKLPALIGSEATAHYPTVYSNAFQKKIVNGEWYEALDFLEYTLKFDAWGYLSEKCNKILELENIGYRIIDNTITPITNPLEIDTVNEALQAPYSSVNEHLDRALEFLSDKKQPDYRNSIKESISAVEAICKLISGDKKGTLGKCLAKITSKHPMPGSLKKALDSLYGYTSNEGGIRHALTEDDVTPTFADAKFMLVSCTAFVNYLLTIAAEENLSFETN